MAHAIRRRHQNVELLVALDPVPTLRLVGLAQRVHAQSNVLDEAQALALRLLGQLARRTQDQRTEALLAGFAQVTHDRHEERGRFARSGGRTREQRVTGGHDGNGLHLNGRWFSVAACGQILDELLGEFVL